MRIVTLLPAATEIVAALGIDPVGVSHECDYPPGVADAPVITHSRIDQSASSAQIDEQVLEAERAGGVYAIDLDALARADPDLVVTQGVCDVCAVDHVLVEDAVDELGLDCEILTTDSHRLEDVFEDVRRVGAAVGRRDGAEELVADLRARVEWVRGRAETVDSTPRVAVLDWMDPVMVAGHWIPDLVTAAGGSYGLVEPGARARPREFAELREYDPQVIVVAPCGFGLEDTEDRLAELTERPGWDELTAVREGRVSLLDGNQYANRPGPRLVETLEYLAWAIHPERFEKPPDAARRQAPDATAEP